MRCSLCAEEVAGVNEAFAAGWYAGFCRGDEWRGPCCRACGDARLYLADYGEYAELPADGSEPADRQQ